MSSLDPRKWLSEHALPFWLEHGVDPRLGGFHENVTLEEGKVIPGQRRCMVQARQLFALRTALALDVCDRARAQEALRAGGEFLLERYSLPSGAFRHAVDHDGRPLSDLPDLYAQAFALFGLAELYASFRDEKFRARARELVAYLRRERAVPGGGFTELDGTRTLYRSNPHMHLFEGALAWVEADPGEPLWAGLCRELLALCRERFLDPRTGMLAEGFHADWSRETEQGRYLFEPGHHCEWSWLMFRHEKPLGGDLTAERTRLFDLSDRHGLSARTGALIDQVWSDGSPKLRSSRFWPQCERIKAARRLGRAREAEAAMATLARYFAAPVSGLWFDTMDEDGAFRPQPCKASSLYHIIGGIAEYLAKH